MLTRRKLIMTGIATVAGASGLAAAARLADRYGLIPPDHSGMYGVGETMTYAAQRILMARQPLAREFSRGAISRVALLARRASVFSQRIAGAASGCQSAEARRRM